LSTEGDTIVAFSQKKNKEQIVIQTVVEKQKNKKAQ